MQHPLLAAGGCFMCWQTDFWCWFYIWFFWRVSCWHQKAQNTIPHWRRHSIRWAGQYFICRYLKENWKKGMVAFRRHCKAPFCLSVWAFAQPANTLSSDHFPVSDLYSRSCPRWEPSTRLRNRASPVPLAAALLNSMPKQMLMEKHEQKALIYSFSHSKEKNLI